MLVKHSFIVIILTTLVQTFRMISSTGIYIADVDKRFEPFEINEIKAVEKKRDFCDFCDRPFYEYKMNISRNTIAYEALKNNATFVLSVSSDINLVQPRINCEDLENATIETQYFLQLCAKNGGAMNEYRVTVTFYHTSCSLSIQSYKNSSDYLQDGRSPARSFTEDYLDPAIEFIKTKIDVLKGKLNEVLRKSQNNPAKNPWSCNLCGNVPPPHSSRTLKYRVCDVCGKMFHIQCINKNREKKTSNATPSKVFLLQHLLPKM